ncbi:MAG TPA: nuclear transport factor 2 family protein [Solirubrobacterales bacterium]|nr:nuclear transport factor 2 family protein [Solirubrobacterales bacterium]
MAVEQPTEEEKMSNLDNLKQGYEAFKRGDLDASTENFADDIEWENPNAPQLPNAGTIKGKEDVKAFFAETPQYWSKFEINADEFIEQGDTVVVLGHTDAEGKDTGKSVKAPFVHVWRFGGDQVTRVQVLFDTALVADALGR